MWLMKFCGFFFQMLNKEFGGTIKKKDIREDGQFNINVDPKVAIFRSVIPKMKDITIMGLSIKFSPWSKFYLKG